VCVCFPGPAAIEHQGRAGMVHCSRIAPADKKEKVELSSLVGPPTSCLMFHADGQAPPGRRPHRSPNPAHTEVEAGCANGVRRDGDLANVLFLPTALNRTKLA
jgi:hypothetical protein